MFHYGPTLNNFIGTMYVFLLIVLCAGFLFISSRIDGSCGRPMSTLAVRIVSRTLTFLFA